jgi:hypothetical protein
MADKAAVHKLDTTRSEAWSRRVRLKVKPFGG